MNQLVSTYKMFNNAPIHSSRPRRSLQNQSGCRSTQRHQNAGPTQQRIWHSPPTDYRLETSSAGWHPQHLRVTNPQTNSNYRATRTDRRPFVPTDWATEGGKRLAQKKITDQSTVDRRTLIDPSDERFSVVQQCSLLGLARSSYYYQPVGESADNLVLMERIDKLFTVRPDMGVRRMYHELNTPVNPVNIKRVRRLMRLMGLKAVGPKPTCQSPNRATQSTLIC